MTIKRLSASLKCQLVIPTQQDCSTPFGIIYHFNPQLRVVESIIKPLDVCQSAGLDM